MLSKKTNELNQNIVCSKPARSRPSEWIMIQELYFLSFLVPDASAVLLAAPAPRPRPPAPLHAPAAPGNGSAAGTEERQKEAGSSLNYEALFIYREDMDMYFEKSFLSCFNSIRI